RARGGPVVRICWAQYPEAGIQEVGGRGRCYMTEAPVLRDRCRYTRRMGRLQPGTHVGDALVVRVLGSGSVATVYEALPPGPGRAVKVVEGSFVEGSSTAQARIAQEGEAIAMIEHINVVRWYDSGIDDERVWILLELVEGQNLREILVASGGRLRVERAVAVV